MAKSFTKSPPPASHPYLAYDGSKVTYAVKSVTIPLHGVCWRSDAVVEVYSRTLNKNLYIYYSLDFVPRKSLTEEAYIFLDKHHGNSYLEYVCPVVAKSIYDAFYKMADSGNYSVSELTRNSKELIEAGLEQFGIAVDNFEVFPSASRQYP